MLVALQTMQAQRCQYEGCSRKRYDGQQSRQIGYRLQLAAAVSMRRCRTGIGVRMDYANAVDIMHVHEHGRAAPIPYEEYCEQHGLRYSASVPHHSTFCSGDKNTKNTIEKRARTCIFFRAAKEKYCMSGILTGEPALYVTPRSRRRRGSLTVGSVFATPKRDSHVAIFNRSSE